MRPSGGDYLLFIIVIIAAIALWLLATGKVGGQGLPPKPTLGAAQVEWDEQGDYVLLNQKGNGIQLGIRRSGIRCVALVRKDAPYALTVYRDNHDLVVINLGTAEYRVRCPDRQTAVELAEFLIGDGDNGEGQD